jgi:CRISPR-associated endonuclease/helicase Cas3
MGQQPPTKPTPRYIAHYRKLDNEFQTVEAHLQGVAERAREYADSIGLGALGEILGLLHDLGKLSDEFQDYIQKATGLIDEDEDYHE